MNYKGKYTLSQPIAIPIVDAIIDLDIDTDLGKIMLQKFLSERESNDFVRNYVKQAVECL